MATLSAQVCERQFPILALDYNELRRFELFRERIGLATSEDLTTWTRHPGPVLEPDPLRYELLDPEAWFDQAWRDPWVFRGPDGAFHAYVTARAAEGPARGRAVIGHARSDDLVRWEVLPPVTRPMGFGQMEVPQLLEAGLIKSPVDLFRLPA